jgi:hypothetical protein
MAHGPAGVQQVEGIAAIDFRFQSVERWQQSSRLPVEAGIFARLNYIDLKPLSQLEGDLSTEVYWLLKVQWSDCLRRSVSIGEGAQRPHSSGE